MKRITSRPKSLKFLAGLFLIFGLSAGCADEPQALTPGLDYYVPAQEEFVLLAKQDMRSADRWIVVDIVQPASRPRNGYIEGRVHVFDDKANHLNSENFVPDMLGYFENVTAGPNPNVPGVVVRLDMTPSDMIDKRRFYFALVDDRLTLIRVENQKSEVVSGSYVPARWSIRPKDQIETTAAQWKTRLLSDDPVKVLAALAWLSYEYKDAWKSPEENNYRTDWSRVRAVGAVRHDIAVQERLKVLSKSENLWIRQAAVFVLNS